MYIVIVPNVAAYNTLT